jgi:hypothetical protein
MFLSAIEFHRRDASRGEVMSVDDDQEPPVELDEHRGIAAQKATEERRYSGEIDADLAATRRAQDELERFLFMAPATTWTEAADRAAYLLRRFAATTEGRDPRLRKMIAEVMEDFRRLKAS